MNINISYRDVDELEEFLNMDNVEVKRDMLSLYAGVIDVEYFIPLRNVLWYSVDYKSDKVDIES